MVMKITSFIVFDFRRNIGIEMSQIYALVIADNLENGEKIRRVLDQAGFQTQIVTTGSRAQVQLAFTNPDLIILDLNLPDMPGEVILRQIKAQPRLRHSHLVLLTENLQVAHDAHELADQILLKPIEKEQVKLVALNLNSLV